MRTLAAIAVIVGLFLAQREALSAIPSQSADDFSQFRPITAEQAILGAFFDRPLDGLLRANQTRLEDYEGMMPPHDPPEYQAFIRENVCQAEVVVVGIARTKQSFLTTTDSSIFTTYSFAAAEFLRGRLAYRVTPFDATLQVSLRGGTIQTRNGVIDVKNDEPLELTTRYLLFLKGIPKTSSFELFGPQFSIDRGILHVRSRHELPVAIATGAKSANTVLADIRAATAKCRG